MYRASWIRRISMASVITTMAGFGITSVASASTITNTGPYSTNEITSTVNNRCSIKNDNTVRVMNSNTQTATTGSAEVSGNTTAGMSWSGWSVYDPAAAQAAGTSYAAWRAAVTDWVASHASGNGWNSTEDNLSWAPAASWAGYDPMTWQSNGQSFGNWYNGVEAYLNANSPVWALGWPAEATGSGSYGGATSGNASNSNSANFTININNAARVAAGTNACGQSNFTPPPSTGGNGGGGGAPYTPPTSTGAVLGATAPAQGGGMGGGYGGGMGGGVGGAYTAPTGSTYHAPSSAPAHVVSTPVTPSQPSGGFGGGTSTPPSGGSGGSSSAATISNTGPYSSNVISSQVDNSTCVTNSNNISVTNTSSQTATTGSASSSGNTTTGGAGSGDAANGNGTGVAGTVSS